MNAAWFSSSNNVKKREESEKLVLGKAGTGGEENKIAKKVGQCSCSIDWCGAM